MAVENQTEITWPPNRYIVAPEAVTFWDTHALGCVNILSFHFAYFLTT